MSVYDYDTEIRIPNWYLKLPQKLLNAISDLGLWVNRVFVRPKRGRRKKNNNGRHVTFYL